MLAIRDWGGGARTMAATSVRVNNDTERDVSLLWHRPMEGGLVVAMEVATIAAGRSRVMRGFAGHEFSVWDEDKELQHWTLLKRKQQTFNVSTADPVVVPGAASKKKAGQTDARSASASGSKSDGAAAARAVGRATLGDSVVLHGSFIRAFDGTYARKGDANGKPHWASATGMHLYWGPREMWLLRARFTPGEPTASAYCHSEELRVGHSNDFNWSTTNGGWISSNLTVENAGASTEDKAAARTATIVRFAGCTVPKFNGDYKLQTALCNGRPHWFCDDKSEHGLHLYYGPQGLWLLRSVFRPSDKACSAYCAATDEPPGRLETWHWMRSGGWHEQQLQPAALFTPLDGVGEEEANDSDEDDDSGDDEGAHAADPEEVEEEEWSGEPPEVGEEIPCTMPEGSLQTKRSRDDHADDASDSSTRSSASPNGAAKHISTHEEKPSLKRQRHQQPPVSGDSETKATT
eukprot:COSAG02_NODE_3494_length_6656_cov_2.237151_1_plen_463_part_00